MTFVLIDDNNGNRKEFETMAEAKEKKNSMVSLGADPGDFEITHVDNGSDESQTAADTIDESEGDDAEIVADSADDAADVVEATEQLPDEPPVDTDPLEWIPSAFQDTIDGTVAINRKGFEVLAHYYDIEGTTDMVVSPAEGDGEYCVHKCVAITPEGQQYAAYGEAHRDECGNEMVRMSDTRAYKRAVSRATGCGMVAVEELQNEL